jgi:hypothetical protein
MSAKKWPAAGNHRLFRRFPSCAAAFRPILHCRIDAATWKKDWNMNTKKYSVVYLGKISKETKAPTFRGSPELGNPIYAYSA